MPKNWLGAISAVVWGDTEGITLQKRDDGSFMIYVFEKETAIQSELSRDELCAIRDACNELLE